jgi:hypothetical protein
MAQATAPILDSTETDMPTAWRNVRYRVRSGKHLLATSISGFNPEQSSRWATRTCSLTGAYAPRLRLWFYECLTCGRTFNMVEGRK